MRFRSRTFIAALGIAAANLAGAAEPSWPDGQAIDAARGRARDAFGQVPATPQPAAKPAFEGLPAKPAGIDPQVIARAYQDMAAPDALPQPARLLAFVSLAMPAESLKRLARDAERAGATLVLKGFVNDSMNETLKAVKAILGEDGRTAWQIDPPAFARYGVDAAPTYVLARHANGEASDFIVVAGDVSLGYALDRIAAERPAFRPQAAEFRRRLPAGD